MTQRTVEDQLREEYFLLSSEIRRVLHRLQTDVASSSTSNGVDPRYNLYALFGSL
jgi:hypothetical protein